MMATGTAAGSPPVFDGHNDGLSRLYDMRPDDPVAAFTGGYDAALDLGKARRGGFAGGFFAMWVPPREADDDGRRAAMAEPSYDIPLPPELDAPHAALVTLAQADIMAALDAAGALRICRSVADIKAAMADGRIAAIMHLEGVEAIDPGLAMLDRLHGMGLRSLGPVWSRPNIFGHGVPFRYPSSPDTGPGLTAAGKRLVSRCDELGVLIDLSHINEAGFWDIARLSKAPLIATHSNVHAICPHARNLTDDQLRAIADSDGMVGLNFATAFLRPDGRMLADAPFEVMMRHLDHLIGILGEDRVGLGSDYDGTMVPDGLTTVAELPALSTAMTRHGFDEELRRKICCDNWLAALGRVWREG